ncbi:MAG: DUF3784 domain-containing protein [Candidatus Peregrinibacteria bacterium]|nr:DUF3784 domain-containing protein [Candidatus Peregrinibacteria bacterium]
MEKSKIFKISGAILVLLLIIVGVSLLNNGDLLQGKLTRKGNIPKYSPIQQIQKDFQSEKEYLLSECSQLNGKKYTLDQEYKKLDAEFWKVAEEREKEYKEIEAQYNNAGKEYTLAKAEHDVYKAEYDSYKAEYDVLIEQLKVIAKEQGFNLEEFKGKYDYLLYTYNNMENGEEKTKLLDQMKLAKNIGTQMVIVVDKMEKLNADKGAPIAKKIDNVVKKINNVVKKMKELKTIYDQYTAQLTELEGKMKSKSDETSLLEQDIQNKCGTPTDTPPSTSTRKEELERNKGNDKGLEIDYDLRNF